MKLDITYEQADSILVETLLESLVSNIEDRDRLKGRDDLPDYEKENLKDAKNQIRDLVRVLRYFTIQQDFLEKVAPLVPNHEKFLKGRS